MPKYKYAMFILTYWRAEDIKTLKMLEDNWYTGDTFLVISDDDKQKDLYLEKYWDKCIVFNKREELKNFDICDNFTDDRAVVFARNFNFRKAKEMWYDYFFQFDDDYNDLMFRFNEKWEYHFGKLQRPNLDNLFEVMIDFMASTPTDSLALAQSWDFIGWSEGLFGEKIFLKRKVMNTFLFRTNATFKFTWRINEDVNLYTLYWGLWKLFFTTNFVSIFQGITQSNEWWLTDIYLESWTYVKSFYTVMQRPNCSKVRLMHTENARLHHQINWEKAVPKIIREDHKKK